MVARAIRMASDGSGPGPDGASGLITGESVASRAPGMRAGVFGGFFIRRSSMTFGSLLSE